MSRPDDTLLLESYHMSQTKKSTPRETHLSGKHQHLFFLLTHFLMDLLLQWVILRGFILELFYFSRSTFKALNLTKLFFQFTCKNLVISTLRLTWNLISQLIPTRCLLHIITFYISSNSSILTDSAACSNRQRRIDMMLMKPNLQGSSSCRAPAVLGAGGQEWPRWQHSYVSISDKEIMKEREPKHLTESLK